VFNEKKIAVLRALVKNGPMTPPEIAIRTGRYPARSMYSYLRRLAKWELVTRGRIHQRGPMVYAITEKGKQRLAWLLASQPEPK
jgi:DNA-binding PadR family transcriptional regulator